jgi:hypothetical protein
LVGVIAFPVFWIGDPLLPLPFTFVDLHALPVFFVALTFTPRHQKSPRPGCTDRPPRIHLQYLRINRSRENNERIVMMTWAARAGLPIHILKLEIRVA